MKYMGSKNRYAKDILPLILGGRLEGQWYVEPFVGGANMIDKVSGNRIGSDIHEYQIKLLNALCDGWLPPEKITEVEYAAIRATPKDYSMELVGYVGFQLTYGAKWMDSYRRDSIGKRCYSSEAYKNVSKQAPKLMGIQFRHCRYNELKIPKDSIVYCDPPYAGTTGYRDDFDHDAFWLWCNGLVAMGHKVFVSEYTAPDGWVKIWSKEVNSSLTKNTGSKKGVECLFIHHNQDSSRG